MPEYKLLSALNVSKSTKTIKEIRKENLSLNELKLIAKIKGYESISEDKLLSALNKSKPVKTKREIRKEYCDEDKMFRDLRFLFDTEKDIVDPKKLLVLLIITIFNMKVREIKTEIYLLKNILMLSNHNYVI